MPNAVRTLGVGVNKPTPDKGSKRILVVDDDFDFSAAIGEILDSEGYAVRLAHSAKEACEAAGQFQAHVALLDIRLGRDNGIELIGRLKAVDPDIVCVMMTGHAALDTAIQALQQGAYNYLRKPIDGLDLLTTLERCFEKIALQDDKQRAEAALSRRNAELEALTVRLRGIVESTRHLAATQHLKVLLPLLLQEMKSVFFADHGSLYLRDGATFVLAHADAGISVPGAVTLEQARGSILRELVDAGMPVLVPAGPVAELPVGLPGSSSGPELFLPLFGDTATILGFTCLSRSSRVPFTHQDKDLGLLLSSVCSEILRSVEGAEALSNSEQRYRLLAAAVEHAAESIMITDPNGTIQHVNPAFVKLTGYTREETLGKTPRILRSGKMDDAFYETLWRTLAAGEVWQGRFVNRTKSGQLVEQEATISAIRDDRNIITSYVSVARDVTNEVELEAQLRQAQKLEAIGTLAGGIAHDFNNMLSPILGYAELAMTETDEGTELWHSLQEIRNAGKRASALVKQILAFSRRSEQERRPVSLEVAIGECMQLLRGSLPSTISIRQDLEACPPVFADPTQMHQVIMNLCTNAYHAMRDSGGVLTVGLRAATVAGSSLASSDLPPGEYAQLSIGDTGAGMDESTLVRIFEPYFTTKKMGEGTGLGLATVHGIVRSHHGRIDVESTPGRGTEFNVFLPVAASAEGLGREAPVERDYRRGNERILLVDDEPAIVDMLTRSLAMMGYQVEGFTESTRAMEAFSERPGDFDLIISDQTMPRLTGLDLARQAMALRPCLPVILTTGFSETVNEQIARDAGIRAFLLKPVPPRLIAEHIREIFREPRA